MFVGLVGGVSGYIGVNRYAADDSTLEYTDCVAPSFVDGYARFQRPITDTGTDYQYTMPGGRLRFRSDAKVVNVLLRYNGLITRTDARNSIGAVYIDGAFSSNFSSPQSVNVVTVGRLNIVNATASDRLYEIILPYADGVEFGGVEVDKPYVVTAATAKTGSLMVCYGDSITQGFHASEVRKGWPFLLAEAKGYRCINMGYGGRQTTVSDGTAIANLNPDLITVLIGTNDYLNQKAVATYQSDLTSLLQNINAVNSTVPVYISAPIDCGTSLTIPLSDYQAVPGAVISSLGYAQLHGVNKSTLITDFGAQMNADGVHPNDAGNTQMASGWGAAI